LLFTDIEASTRLLHALGDDGSLEALTEHRRVIRGGENYKACFAQM
jgi:class 3 adenylate cyclase